MVWVSQPCHSLSCWSSIGCKTKPWESFWEIQPIETMRYLLGLPSMEARQKMHQFKAYLSAMQNPKIPLHDAVKEEKGCRLARGKSWMGQAEQLILHVCGLTELKQLRDLKKSSVEFKPYYKTLLSNNLCTHCCEWLAEKPVQMYKCLSKPTASNLTSWSMRTAQSQGTGLVRFSRLNRVDGLFTKIVEPTESQPLSWPWK